MSDAGTILKSAMALHRANRLAEALTLYDQVLTLEPHHAEALCHRGTLLWELDRKEDGLASMARANACRPNYLEALYNEGAMLQQCHRLDEAIGFFHAVLALKPDFPPALNNLAGALQEMGRPAESLAVCERALAAQPRAGLFYNRGVLLTALGRNREALASHQNALRLDPRHSDAFGCLAGAALRLCDWPLTARLKPEVERHVAQARSLIAPMVLLGYSGDPALQLACAGRMSAVLAPTVAPPLRARRGGDKIRLAYVSADFRDHPVAYLIAELIERHDRNDFEVMGLSLSPDDGGTMRPRLAAAFDSFHDAGGKSDAEAAALLRALRTDIAIDLMGHTQGARPGIFAQRAAPLQVNYLGYPGTMGADFIDYVIADPVVAPFEHQPFFREQIVHLPDCYQPSDSTRRLGQAPSRGEAGLPEQGLVFCCFNNAWKITAEIFGIWMRLLGAVPDSVLWLLEDDSAMPQWRREAAARGIAPERLVFAPRLGLDAHLARHQLADLFLDTLPYNAHTTANDSLRAGVPVITRRGEAFAGRVAASLLGALGLPELVTETAEAYHALALGLARDPARLRSLREKLARQRVSHPLFDTARFTRAIEAAYRLMQDRAEAGRPPQNFAVSGS